MKNLEERHPSPWKALRWYEERGRNNDPAWYGYEPGDALPPLSRIEDANGRDVAAASDLFDFDQDGIRLMATAPELLALLKYAVLRVKLANEEGNPILSAWLPDAEAAIARTRGDEPLAIEPGSAAPLPPIPGGKRAFKVVQRRDACHRYEATIAAEDANEAVCLALDDECEWIDVCVDDYDDRSLEVYDADDEHEEFVLARRGD